MLAVVFKGRDLQFFNLNVNQCYFRVVEMTNLVIECA